MDYNQAFFFKNGEKTKPVCFECYHATREGVPLMSQMHVEKDLPELIV